MPTVTFIEANGTEHAVDARSGTSLMEVAVANLVPGILGDCGGNCSCATCHTYIEAGWAEKVPQASGEELEILEGALDVSDNSRLACQIVLNDGLDGLVVRVPLRQY
ncbi:2Fe-2S iron-sulfur cluster-binding protein [Pseudomonas silvicola]|nr:2Fe-2S iron-sulfur cluster-binding protein [Pseudomonas silvicola]